MTNKFSFLIIGMLIGLNYLASQTTGNLPIDEVTGLITYQEVVQEEGNKEAFFNRAIGWINEYYTNPVDVTKVRDPQTGKIEGLHRMKIKSADNEGTLIDAGVIQYEFTLEFKEGRYRYILSNFVFRQSSRVPVEKWMDKNDPQYNPLWDGFLQQIDEFAKSWVESLKKGMKPKPVAKDDTW